MKTEKTTIKLDDGSSSDIQKNRRLGNQLDHELHHARIWFFSGEYSLAINHIERMRSKVLLNIECHVILARCYARLDHWDHFKKYVLLITRRFPQAAYGMLIIARELEFTCQQALKTLILRRSFNCYSNSPLLKEKIFLEFIKIKDGASIKRLSRHREISKELTRIGAYLCNQSPGDPNHHLVKIEKLILDIKDSSVACRILKYLLYLEELGLALFLLRNHEVARKQSQNDTLFLGKLLLKRGFIRDALSLCELALQTYSVASLQSEHWTSLKYQCDVLIGGWKPPKLSIRRSPGTNTRILHVVSFALPENTTGYSIRTHAILKSQIGLGLCAEAISFEYPTGINEISNVKNFIEGCFYNKILTPRPPVFSLPYHLTSATQSLYQFALQNQIGLLHCASNYVNALIALPIGKALNIPVVYEFRGLWHESAVSKSQIKKESDLYDESMKIEIQCAHNADAVVTLSHSMRMELIAHGVTEEKIHVIPNAVDPSRFSPRPKNPTLTEKLQITMNEVVIGYITTFERFEDVETLLESIKLLVKEGHRIKCLLVGEGPCLRMLKAKSYQLELGNTVIFTGRIDFAIVDEYYDLIDIFVVPRTADRVSQLVLPIKPFEAMASGKAIVASDTSVIREIVTNGINGLLFTPGSVQQLTVLLRRLIDCPQERRKLGIEARKWVTDARTWNLNVKLYQELYRKIGLPI